MPDLIVIAQKVRRRGQACAELLLDLFAVLERHMLHDVSVCRSHDGLRVGVLSDDSRHLRILHRSHMYLQMRFVILIHKRLRRLAHQNRHVLRHRVQRLGLRHVRHELLSVLDAKGLDHLPVQHGEVIDSGR